MKRISAFIIILLFIASTPSVSKNLKELEEIIDTILMEEGAGKAKPDVTVEENDKPAIRQTDKNERGEKRYTPAQSSPGRTLLETALQLYDASLYGRAQSNLQKLKNDYPEQFGDIASLWLAKIKIKINKYEEAITELESVNAGSGEYPAALFYLGEANIKKGDIESAILYYNNIASLFPEHELADDALLMISRLYLDLKKGSLSLEASLKILKEYKGKETEDDALFMAGKIFERASKLRDFGIARRIYKKFLERSEDPGRPVYYKSPLKTLVENNLRELEISYFSLEN